MPDWQSSNTVELGGAPDSGVWQAFSQTALPMWQAGIKRRLELEDQKTKNEFERQMFSQKLSALSAMEDKKDKNALTLEEIKSKHALETAGINNKTLEYDPETGKLSKTDEWAGAGKWDKFNTEVDKMIPTLKEMFPTANMDQLQTLAHAYVYKNYKKNPMIPDKFKKELDSLYSSTPDVEKEVRESGKPDPFTMTRNLAAGALPFLAGKAVYDRTTGAMKQGLFEDLVRARGIMEQGGAPSKMFNPNAGAGVLKLGYSPTPGGSQVSRGAMMQRSGAIPMPQFLASQQMDSPAAQGPMFRAGQSPAQMASDEALQAAYKAKWGLPAAQKFLKGTMKVAPWAFGAYALLNGNAADAAEAFSPAGPSTPLGGAEIGDQDYQNFIAMQNAVLPSGNDRNAWEDYYSKTRGGAFGGF